MADYNKFAFAAFNRWVSADLDQNGLMDIDIVVKNKTYSTMIPARETPEVANSVAYPEFDRQTPYILYHLQNDEENSTVYKKCESITYAVFGPTSAKVMAIVACIQDLTARLDWSVIDLNDFNDSNTIDPNNFDSQFSFVGMTFEEITGPDPIKQEGGRYGGMVSISYEYVLTDIIGEPGAKGQGRRR